jgi:hypothetical protein
MTGRRIAVVIAALLAVLAPSSGAASATASPLEQEVSRALRQLAALRTTAGEPGAAYERDYFGTAWADVDGNDCRTRDDVLARDLRSVQKRDTCTVVSGVLADPYTGARLTFVKSNASAIQIDHVVPLSLAWHSGADAWSTGKRATFANDPLNLLAVDGPTNQRKGDSGPSEWLPPNTRYACTYVMRFVRVSFLYGATIATADRAAAKRVLRRCTVVKGHPTTMRALAPSLWAHAATYVHATPSLTPTN